jgi:cobalt-zinc-cadmium efflux system outer membrane protein
VTLLSAVATLAGAQPISSTQPPGQPGTGPPLRLVDAVHEAVSRHPDLAALDTAVAAERAKPAVERELMPPMVDLQAWEWPLDQWNPRYAQWMVTLQQEFPGRGKRAARTGLMEAEAARMASEAGAKRRAIAADVARTYVDLRVARAEQAWLAGARDTVRRSIEAAEVRYAAGRSSQQDVLAGIVELSRLDQDAVMSGERERMARSRLNILLGRDADAPIGVLDPVEADRAVPRLADLETRLKETHPEMTAIDRTRDVAAADVALARTLGKPDYVVEAGYMTMPYMPDSIQFRVGFTWPSAPWVRRRVDAATVAAEKSIAAAESRRDGVMQALRLAAQESIVRATAASERVAVVQDAVVPRVQHALEVAEIAYQADRGEFMPLVDAQRVLIDARIEIIRAQGDRDRALAELQALLGDLDGGGR